MHLTWRRLAGFMVVLAVMGGASCGDDSSPSASSGDDGGTEEGQPAVPAEDGALADGPVTVVAVGDSLTYGEGDEEGIGGFAGRLTEAIAEESGREDSTLVNLGVSGWTSQMVVEGEGEGGLPGQLPQAVEEVGAAVESGSPALATVLVGSNDLWFTYEYAEGEGTSAEAEDAALEMYRTYLDQTVTELQDAGALVVVGLPDDQSIRPAVVDLEVLNQQLPNVTEEEVEQMSALSVRMDEVAAEVAAEHGAPTVDTNGSFWADQATMADDGIHPNAAGYAELAALWQEAIQPAL